MGLCLQEILGGKRGKYMMLTCEAIDARKCLKLGAVNEVVDADKIVDREWEIAKGIMTKSRSYRRLTYYICVSPWKAVVECMFRSKPPTHFGETTGCLYRNTQLGATLEFMYCLRCIRLICLILIMTLGALNIKKIKNNN